ncbi:MAG TPA: A/G-specific adenine glycosylase [Planctomycetota bacterium]|jgi:A/G-specific adenine glycosylase
MRAAPLAPLLLDWFASHKRDLPWRRTNDPYRIWLSEIMLQQTQVATVIPYYERFLQRFPTLESLAAAPIDDVLKLWAGLGYYSRARHLHRGAQTIVARFGGRVPETLEEIREVPGIGPYTAGAVLSIAYGKPVPLVDGNVARVLSRVNCIAGDWRTGPCHRALWSAAGELMNELERGEREDGETGGRRDGGKQLGCGRREAGGRNRACACRSIRNPQPEFRNPGDLNQSLMELGATLCRPRQPLCDECPVAAHCAARRTGRQEEFPTPMKKNKVPVWNLRAWIALDASGRVLLARRNSGGLFGGLWEVPTERASAREKPRPPAAGHVIHVLSHRELRIELCRTAEAIATARLLSEDFTPWSGTYGSFKWFTLRAALSGRHVALSSLQKKILSNIEQS